MSSVCTPSVLDPEGNQVLAAFSITWARVETIGNTVDAGNLEIAVLQLAATPAPKIHGSCGLAAHAIAGEGGPTETRIAICEVARSAITDSVLTL